LITNNLNTTSFVHSLFVAPTFVVSLCIRSFVVIRIVNDKFKQASSGQILPYASLAFEMLAANIREKM